MKFSALTFTRKSGGQIEERVDLLLPLGYVDTWISTFHSFCKKILKNHALDIGLPIKLTALTPPPRQWVLLHNNFEKFNLDYYSPSAARTNSFNNLLA